MVLDVPFNMPFKSGREKVSSDIKGSSQALLEEKMDLFLLSFSKKR